MQVLVNPLELDLHRFKALCFFVSQSWWSSSPMNGWGRVCWFYFGKQSLPLCWTNWLINLLVFLCICVSWAYKKFIASWNWICLSFSLVFSTISVGCPWYGLFGLVVLLLRIHCESKKRSHLKCFVPNGGVVSCIRLLFSTLNTDFLWWPQEVIWKYYNIFTWLKFRFLRICLNNELKRYLPYDHYHHHLVTIQPLKAEIDRNRFVNCWQSVFKIHHTTQPWFVRQQ